MTASSIHNTLRNPLPLQGHGLENTSNSGNIKKSYLNSTKRQEFCSQSPEFKNIVKLIANLTNVKLKQECIRSIANFNTKGCTITVVNFQKEQFSIQETEERDFLLGVLQGQTLVRSKELDELVCSYSGSDETMKKTKEILFTKTDYLVLLHKTARQSYLYFGLDKGGQKEQTDIARIKFDQEQKRWVFTLIGYPLQPEKFPDEIKVFKTELRGICERFHSKRLAECSDSD